MIYRSKKILNDISKKLMISSQKKLMISLIFWWYIKKTDDTIVQYGKFMKKKSQNKFDQYNVAIKKNWLQD